MADQMKETAAQEAKLQAERTAEEEEKQVLFLNMHSIFFNISKDLLMETIIYLMLTLYLSTVGLNEISISRFEHSSKEGRR